MARKRGRRRNRKVTKAVKQYVKKVINDETEMKFWENQIFYPTGSSQNSNVGFVESISSIPEGVTNATRIGNKIKPVYLSFKYDIGPSPGIASPTMFRIIILQDKQNTGVPPTPDEILFVVEHNAPYERIALLAKRFNILYDRLHQLDPYWSVGALVNPTFTNQTFQQASKKIRLKGTMDWYDTTTPGKSSLWLMLLSDEPAISSPYFDMFYSLTFTDA